MLEGRVNRYEEPVVSIQLILRNRRVSFLAVIDTGFNGYLSAPKRLLAGGGWQAIGREEYEIATGDLVEQEVYFGEVVFDGRRRRVFTVGTESHDILVGTKLLRDKALLVNFRSKRVTVT